VRKRGEGGEKWTFHAGRRRLLASRLKSKKLNLERAKENEALEGKISIFHARSPAGKRVLSERRSGRL